MNPSEDTLKDVPIFIGGEEVIERPEFRSGEDLAAYLSRIAEGRDMCIVTDHPHDDESNVLSIHLGEGPLPKCSRGCDD